MSETKHFVSLFPAGLLEPHLALPNRVLVRGLYGVQLPTPHLVDLHEASSFRAIIFVCGFGKVYGCGALLRVRFCFAI